MDEQSLIPPPAPHPGSTLERHILDRQRANPTATGDFTGLFHQISLAAKIIHSRVSRAGLAGVLGLTGDVNIQGEQVAKLDDFANRTIIKSLEGGGHVCALGSEEVEEFIPVPPHYPAGKYVILFDPLDGSGNIDINASIGTIFSILRRVTPSGRPGELADCLQAGHRQVAAGYVIYGSSAMLVYSDGDGVYGFTFDPGVGEFFLSHPYMRIPERGSIYSVNEGNYHNWTSGVQKWVDWVKSPDNAVKKAYSHRYIGAVVADFHRTLLRGGIFAYPGDAKKTRGKLRLLYEANPLAYIAEAAGGAASTGTGRVLDVEPTELHQRTPLFVGSKLDVEEATAFLSRS